MSLEYSNARSAARQLALFFLTPLETERFDIAQIRELRDLLTIIDFYLERRRQYETNRLLNGFGDQCQIRDGYVGDYVSNNGSGRDYELLPGEASGELVEVQADGPKSCRGESSGMQCG